MPEESEYERDYMLAWSEGWYCGRVVGPSRLMPKHSAVVLSVEGMCCVRCLMIPHL